MIFFLEYKFELSQGYYSSIKELLTWVLLIQHAFLGGIKIGKNSTPA